MEINAIESSRGRGKSLGRDIRNPNTMKCFRCGKTGHRAAVCRTCAGDYEHSCLTRRRCVVGGPAKNRAVPVGVGRPSGRNGAPSTQVAARAPSP